jgi:hypothetical protein
MHSSDQTLKFFTAAITSFAATRLPQCDVAAIVANITKQMQEVRQEEVGHCTMVVCWKRHKYLQCHPDRGFPVLFPQL